MKQASIFLALVITLGLASCSGGGLGGDSIFGSLLSKDKERKEETRVASRERRDENVTSGSRRTKWSGRQLIGGIQQSRMAKTLNQADLGAASEAEYRALETGKPGVATPWRNPQNGRYGNVVASKPFKQQNIFCRQYTHTIYINGRPEILRGIACRKKNGSWENLG